MNTRLMLFAILSPIAMAVAAETAQRPRHVLEQFETTTLSISQIVFPANGDAAFAYVQSPDGLIHRVGNGDYVAPHGKQVSRVDRCGVFLAGSEGQYGTSGLDASLWIESGACRRDATRVAEIVGSARSVKLPFPRWIKNEHELGKRDSSASAIMHVAKKGGFLFFVENRPFGMMPYEYIYVYAKADDGYVLVGYVPAEVTQLKIRVDGRCVEMVNGEHVTFASMCTGFNQSVVGFVGGATRPTVEVE